MDADELVILIPIVTIVGGLGIAALGIYKSIRLRELAFRERIAMIERGLVPPAAVAPAGRDRPRGSGGARAKYRTAGTVLIGIGLALTILITFAAGQPGVAVGVGGAFAVLGLAFVVSGLWEERNEPADAQAGTAPPPPARIPEP